MTTAEVHHNEHETTSYDRHRSKTTRTQDCSNKITAFVSGKKEISDADCWSIQQHRKEDEPRHEPGTIHLGVWLCGNSSPNTIRILRAEFSSYKPGFLRINVTCELCFAISLFTIATKQRESFMTLLRQPSQLPALSCHEEICILPSGMHTSSRTGRMQHSYSQTKEDLCVQETRLYPPNTDVTTTPNCSLSVTATTSNRERENTTHFVEMYDRNRNIRTKTGSKVYCYSCNSQCSWCDIVKRTMNVSEGSPLKITVHLIFYSTWARNHSEHEVNCGTI